MDLDAKIELSLVLVRLMSNSLYPIIFSPEQETKCKEAFRTVFEGKQDQLREELEKVAVNGIVENYYALTQAMQHVRGDFVCIDKKMIECGFVILLRGVEFS